MSPRKKKHRTCVCPLREKLGLVFKPAGIPLKEMARITLELDELEAFFLCDGQDMSQERAGEKMGISRGTVQRLLSQGRKKVIDALVGQKALVVAGAQAAQNNATGSEKTAAGEQPSLA